MANLDDKARILFYDIETTDLDADFGNMVSFGYKWAGEKKAHVISILDTNKICDDCGHVDAVGDKPLVREAAKILSEADVWVTWYGKGFDEKFVTTRIMDAGLRPLPPVPHIDLYFTAKHKLKLSSNRLASVQDFLRLPTSKTPITKREWRKAQAGHVPSIRYINDHCLKDVMVLEEAYEKLKPLIRQHPRVGAHGACDVCGSTRLHSRGSVVRRDRALRKPVTYNRVQCQECGAWGKR